MKKSNAAIITTSEYRQFIGELKSRVLAARVSAARSVNRDVILLYWDIGRGIVEKQRTLGWGESVVEMVAADLTRAFPDSRSFSSDNVWRMRQLYLAYSDSAFLGQVVPEIASAKSKRRRPSILGQSVPEIVRKTTSADHDPVLSQSVRELVASVPW